MFGNSVAAHLFSRRIISLRPDQISSTAQTLTSTRPIGRATSRITSSVMSVGTLEAFLGQLIQTKPDGDYVGFVTKETATEVELRDPSGKVSALRKDQIRKRGPQPGSMMPEGLADGLSLDDFSSLIAFLTSLK